jgi:hypothetical protein
MPTITSLPNVLEARGAGVSGAKNTCTETKSREALDADLSVQAVQIDGIFAEPASVEELQLLQRLFVLPRNETPRGVVFCGVGLSDVAAFVCARAAEILASEVNEPVCLVNFNLKDATLHDRYDLDAGVSFSARIPVNEHYLWVLPASACRESCSGLSRDRVGNLLSRLRERFRFLLICAPPLDSAPDGFLLGQMSDGVVLILQAHSTYRVTALKARRDLEAYDIPLLGAVLIEQPANRSFIKYWKAQKRESGETVQT